MAAAVADRMRTDGSGGIGGVGGAGGVGVGAGSHAHASYPPPMRRPLPTASASAPASTSTAATTSYLIHTETDSIHDLRLQISIEPPASTSAGNQPLRPLYFRERELTEQGEIVDYLIDASTAHVPWSIHKPARGWYLRLRSPALPPGTALPFRTPPNVEAGQRGVRASRDSSSSAGSATTAQGGKSHDSSRSPLVISVPTRVHLPSLRRTKETIDDVLVDPSSDSPTRQDRGMTDQLAEISLADGAHPSSSTQNHARTSSASFLRLPHGRSLSGAHKKDDAVPDDQDTGSFTPSIIAEDIDTSLSSGQGTATATSTSRSTPLLGSQGHTRRRSAGSGSHRVEVRKVSNEPRDVLLRERVDEEEEDKDGGGGAEGGRRGKNGLQLETGHLGKSADRLSPNDASTSSLGRDVLGSAGGGSSSTQSYSADRPYSPTEPSAVLHPLGKEEGDQSGPSMANKVNAGADPSPIANDLHRSNGNTTGEGSQRNGPSAGGRPLIGGKTAPMLCHFVLLDGVDAASYETRLPYLPPSVRRGPGTQEGEGEGSSSSPTPASTTTTNPATTTTAPTEGSPGAGAVPGGGAGIDSFRRRWANWAWSKLPTSIRPGALPLDTSHDFSLHWTNPPVLEEGSTRTSIEVLRYRDLEGWSIFTSWNAQRRGRLVMQEEAVRALGLDRAFWAAVALAYLDFLEGRDSYHAACEG